MLTSQAEYEKFDYTIQNVIIYKSEVMKIGQNVKTYYLPELDSS